MNMSPVVTAHIGAMWKEQEVKWLVLLSLSYAIPCFPKETEGLYTNSSRKVKEASCKIILLLWSLVE
jgi:hypothetical protein